MLYLVSITIFYFDYHSLHAYESSITQGNFETTHHHVFPFSNYSKMWTKYPASLNVHNEWIFSMGAKNKTDGEQIHIILLWLFAICDFCLWIGGFRLWIILPTWHPLECKESKGRSDKTKNFMTLYLDFLVDCLNYIP